MDKINLLESGFRDVILAWEAGKPQGWCTREKAESMIRAILSDKPPIIVEIGVHGGRSLTALGLAAKVCGSKVYGIDTWSKEHSIRGMKNPQNISFWSSVKYDDIRRESERAIKSLNLSGVVTLINEPSASAVSRFADNTIGVFHLNGNPTRSLDDVKSYLPKIADGGLIYLSDVGWTEALINVVAPAARFLEDNGCSFVERIAETFVYVKGTLKGKVDDPQVYRLVTYKYEDPILQRELELRECEWRNRRTAEYLTIEGKYREPVTFAQMFRKINEVTSSDDIAIVANSDIYFDESLKLARDHLSREEVWALSYWDVAGGSAVLCDRGDTQAAWVFRGKIKDEAIKAADFPLGLGGSDNRIARVLFDAGYRVRNPSRDVRALHLHKDANTRRWLAGQVPGPHLHIGPHPVNDSDDRHRLVEA